MSSPRYCPNCGSPSLGYPVPDDALAIRVGGTIDGLTLISQSRGVYLSMHDVEHQPCICIECGARVAAPTG